MQISLTELLKFEPIKKKSVKANLTNVYSASHARGCFVGIQTQYGNDTEHLPKVYYVQSFNPQSHCVS